MEYFLFQQMTVIQSTHWWSGGRRAILESFINTLLRSLFAAERHVLEHIALPFGVSIIAQCQKS